MCPLPLQPCALCCRVRLRLAATLGASGLCVCSRRGRGGSQISSSETVSVGPYWALRAFLIFFLMEFIQSDVTVIHDGGPWSWTWRSEWPLQCTDHWVRVAWVPRHPAQPMIWSEWKENQGNRFLQSLYSFYIPVMKEGSSQGFCCIPPRGRNIINISFDNIHYPLIEIGDGVQGTMVQNLNATSEVGVVFCCEDSASKRFQINYVSFPPQKPRNFSCKTENLRKVNCTWDPGRRPNLASHYKLHVQILGKITCHYTYCEFDTIPGWKEYTITVTVTNSLGKESENYIFNITDIGEIQSIMTLVMIKDSEANIIIQSYQVTWEDLNQQKNLSVSADKNQAKITVGLGKCSISVKAVNKAGSSMPAYIIVPSKEVKNSTLQGFLLSWAADASATCGYTVEWDTVRSYNVSNKPEIQWKRVPVECTSLILPAGNSLPDWCRYTFRIFGCTRNGHLLLEKQEGYTEEDSECVAGGSTSPPSAVLKWTFPEDDPTHPGFITGYLVTVKLVLSGPRNITVDDPHKKSCDIPDLQEDMEYTITVQARTSAGLGPHSELMKKHPNRKNTVSLVGRCMGAKSPGSILQLWTKQSATYISVYSFNRFSTRQATQSKQKCI
uniref:Leukemia inhibitory factor receptor-like n=1 Tax=Scleropages formosus TaxID=113540 RepID=A0A8C9T9Z4_SCLFO